MSKQVRSVAVIGAGMVGLATAFQLRARDVEVTVLDRTGVSAGASWGNAGWLTPAIATPLPDPAILRYGVRAVVSPNSPVYVPVAADAQLARFMGGFLRNSTQRRWGVAMKHLIAINEEALPAFDELRAQGVTDPVYPADPHVCAFARGADAGPLVDEFEHIEAMGGAVDYEFVPGRVAREIVPALSEKVKAAILIRGQQFINPITYLDSLAAAVREQGVRVIEGTEVTALTDDSDGVTVTASGDGSGRYDAVVIATGAWLGRLSRAYGVRMVVQAGRGYSFSSPADPMPSVPIYLPVQRVAMTPLGDRLRVAGMMEFRRPDKALDPRRIRAIVDSARPFLHGVDLEDRADEWVGARPVTADGLPLIGATRSERVFVAGGHGMWGITLGPITGRLLAEQIVTGHAPAILRPFDPLR